MSKREHGIQIFTKVVINDSGSIIRWHRVACIGCAWTAPWYRDLDFALELAQHHLDKVANQRSTSPVRPQAGRKPRERGPLL